MINANTKMRKNQRRAACKTAILLLVAASLIAGPILAGGEDEKDSELDKTTETGILSAQVPGTILGKIYADLQADNTVTIYAMPVKDVTIDSGKIESCVGTICFMTVTMADDAKAGTPSGTIGPFTKGDDVLANITVESGTDSEAYELMFSVGADNLTFISGTLYDVNGTVVYQDDGTATDDKLDGTEDALDGEKDDKAEAIPGFETFFSIAAIMGVALIGLKRKRN